MGVGKKVKQKIRKFLGKPPKELIRHCPNCEKNEALFEYKGEMNDQNSDTIKKIYKCKNCGDRIKVIIPRGKLPE